MRNEVVIDYLCELFGVERVDDIDPYARDCGPHAAHALVLWNVAQFELTARGTVTEKNQVFEVRLRDGKVHGGLPALGPETLFEGRPVDLDAVIINSISVSNVDATHTAPVDGLRVLGRLNHDHPLLPHLSAHDDAQAHVPGHVRGAALAVEPGKVVQRVDYFYQPEEHYIYLNNYFVKTYALLDEHNIDNGIIKLPAHVAAQSMALQKHVTVGDARGAKRHLSFETYYMVPADHVYAWTLRLPVDEFRRQLGIHAVELRVQERGVLYYAVGDACFELIREQARAAYMGKIFTQCLGTDVGLEWVVAQAPSAPHKLCITAQAHVGYLCVPRGLGAEERARLRPTLAPDFIPYSQVFANNLRQVREQKAEKSKAAVREKMETQDAERVKQLMEQDVMDTGE